MAADNFPPYVTRYFWGDDLTQLDLEKNRKYILEVLLEKGNRRALRWLLSKLDKRAIIKLLPSLNLTKKSANFWQIYFS